MKLTVAEIREPRGDGSKFVSIDTENHRLMMGVDGYSFECSDEHAEWFKQALGKVMDAVEYDVVPHDDAP